MGFEVFSQDQTRPWGGFFVLEEKDAAFFAQIYFPHLEMSGMQITHKLSPKILVIAPNKRLSWQYHFRRSEVWKVIAGTDVGVKISYNNEEPADIEILDSGSFIQIDNGERHRLIGLNNWGLVAEIWRHTDSNQPSNEEDIVRLQDDFGR
ncbi:phosphoheptose isomerase [Lacihabitans soyangensis]|uniref:Phosphoheptose isomerase n=2 Tax=Lacihabitans soyangensis TaxID=869394 RepID=A0AAE3H7S5_9BACT|nr:phosphoheptose isomerase [Lacihabitans soyangensis]